MTTTTAPASVVRDTHIIFSSTPPGQATAQIFRTRLDGTEQVQLTADQTVEHQWPRPSPDGAKVLFYRAAPGSTVNDIDTNSLWVMDADGSNERELLPDGSYGWTRQSHVEWSPDGSRLLMAAGGSNWIDLFITDTDGGSPAQVTHRGPNMALDPSWTPDGAGALFIGCPLEKAFCLWWDNEVYSLDLATGQERRLTYDNFPDFDPYMSPDGSDIVWLRCTGMFPLPPWSIYRASPDQVPLQEVPVVADGQLNSNVDFSADGGTLLFSRSVAGLAPWQTAASVRLDGSGLGFVSGRQAPAGQVSPVYWP